MRRALIFLIGSLIMGTSLLWGICLNQTTLYTWHSMCNLFDQSCTPYPEHNCLILLVYLRCKGKDGNWYTLRETYSSSCTIQAFHSGAPVKNKILKSTK